MTARFVEFKYADITPKRKNDLSHFQILQRLSEKKLFPEIYLDMLSKLETIDDRNELSKKFLKIYLYASTKFFNDPKKLYDWLVKGSIPQNISDGSDNMSSLSQYAKKISSLKKLQEKEIEKIDKAREKISKKSNKRIEESIVKAQDKINLLEYQFQNQREQIENIILEIETSLASTRKL